MADPLPSEPLLARPSDSPDRSSLTQQCSDAQVQVATSVKGLRAEGRRLLDSRAKHYLVMGLVTLDVAALLLNVFIKLIACEMHQAKEPWVQRINDTLEIIGLVFSSLFVLELIACLFSFGLRYLNSMFHLFDSVIIIAGFIIDIATQGITSEIGSLIIALRLWRLAKLSEEIVLGATERINDLEQRNLELSDEVKELREERRFSHSSQHS